MVTQQSELSSRKCPRLDAGSPEVIIYTDGGCRPNPGPGGWAAILWASGMELELGGGAPDTTNNRMEMTAVLAGLNALTGPTKVTVVTDSEYVFNGMTNWITKWSGLGFSKKKRHPLESRPLEDPRGGLPCPSDQLGLDPRAFGRSAQ